MRLLSRRLLQLDLETPSLLGWVSDLLPALADASERRSIATLIWDLHMLVAPFPLTALAARYGKEVGLHGCRFGFSPPERRKMTEQLPVGFGVDRRSDDAADVGIVITALLLCFWSKWIFRSIITGR
ncbi:hypothetical protein ACLOJK_037516 [Asimina triloba]